MYAVQSKKTIPSPLGGSFNANPSFIRVEKDIISVLSTTRLTEPGVSLDQCKHRETPNSVQLFSLPPVHSGILGESNLFFKLMMKRGPFTGVWSEFEIIFPAKYPYSPPEVFLISAYYPFNHESVDPVTKQVYFNYIEPENWSPIYE